MEVILSGQEQLSYHSYMGVGTGYRSLWHPLHHKNRFEILGDHKLLLMYCRPRELIIIYSAAPQSINSGWKFPIDSSDEYEEPMHQPQKIPCDL